MPARSVVLEKLVKYNGETHADITPGEYTQLTGRAGRRGIDIEGHAVVLWQPGLDPRAVAGLASRRTYPLPLLLRADLQHGGQPGRQRRPASGRGRCSSSRSPSSSPTARWSGWPGPLAKNTEAIADYWRAAACDRGDFEAYARLRAEITELEAEAARERRTDRRAEALQSLLALKPGDIVRVPTGKSQGWVVVIDPDTRTDHRGTSTAGA